jgi:hypothetical protein
LVGERESLIWLKGGTLRRYLENCMATAAELRGMAHDLARASLDRRKAKAREVGAYLKQAGELRCGHIIVQGNGSPCPLDADNHCPLGKARLLTKFDNSKRSISN